MPSALRFFHGHKNNMVSRSFPASPLFEWACAFQRSMHAYSLVSFPDPAPGYGDETSMHRAKAIQYRAGRWGSGT